MLLLHLDSVEVYIILVYHFKKGNVSKYRVFIANLLQYSPSSNVLQATSIRLLIISRVYNSKNSVVVLRRHEGSHSLSHNHERLDVLSGPVDELTRCIVLGPQTTADIRQQPSIIKLLE